MNINMMSYERGMYERILDIFNKMQDSCSQSAYGAENWIQSSETKYSDCLSDVNYDILFDFTMNIIQSIPKELFNETDVNMFVNEFTEVTSNIITHTVSNNIMWNIDLKDKFLWVAMMLAVKTTHKIIPYIINLVNGNEYILKHEDSNGNNCFTLACWNMCALNELIKVYPINYLKNSTSNNVTPLDLLAYTGGVIQLLESKIISLDDVLSYVNPYYKINVIHSCSMNIDNTVVLEYFIMCKKLTKEHTYAVDKNGNYPLLISCILKSIRHIDLMINSKLYDEDIINIKNLANRNIISYADTGILKYLIGYIDKTNFFDLKFYNIITNDEIFQLFTKSKLFTFDVLTHNYQNDFPNQTIKLLDWLFFKKRSFLDYVINSDDINITKVMEEVFAYQKNILPMSFDNNIKLPSLIIKSKYMRSDLFKESYNGSTLINKLVNSLNENSDNEILLTNIKELTKCIIDSPHTTIDLISDDFINFCGKYFCDLIKNLIERELIGNIINVIYSMLNNNVNSESIITLFENNYINISQLKGKTDLLNKLIQSNDQLLKILLSSDELNEDIIKLFTHDGIIDIKKIINDNYIISEDIWLLIITNKYLTTNILNAYNEKFESLLKNVESNRFLQLLIENRSDFDHTLLFKRPNSFLHSKCLNKDVETVNYLIEHSLFTKDEYNYLMTMSNVLTYDNFSIVERLIKHKYFDENIINIKYSGNNNLLQYLILCGFENDLILYIINHPKMTFEHFDHRNEKGETCLMLALRTGYNISPIINSKYFKPDMIKIKDNNNLSIEDIIYDHINYEFLLTYLKLFQKSDLLYRHYTKGNTIVHKLIKENKINILIKLLSTSEFDIMITANNNDNTPLHKITSDKEKINKLDALLEMKLSTIKKEYFYLQNKHYEIPLTNIINYIDINHSTIFEKIINLNILTPLDLAMEVSSSNITIGEYILNENTELLKILDKYNFDIPLLLKNKSQKGEPLYFALIRNNSEVTDKYYSKFIDVESLNLKNLSNETLLFEIIEKDEILCNELINMKIINDKIVTPYLDKLILNYPQTIKYLLNSLPELFTKDNLVYCISQCINLNCDALELLLESKKNIVNIFDEISNKPELLTVCLNSTNCLKCIFENNLMTEDILKKDDYKMMFSIDNPVYLKQMSKIVKGNMFNAKQKGKTIFHKCAIYPNLVKFYVKEYIENSAELTALLVKDNNKKTFLDYLVERKYVNDILDIINTINKDILSKLLANQDNNGKNIIMKCCEDKELHQILEMIKSCITKEIFEQFDNNRNLTLMYIARYTSDLFKEVFYPEPDIVLYENTDDDDMFSIVTRYNYKNLKIMLSYNELVDIYNNFNKCFTIACRYEPRSISLLLNTGKVDLKKCNGLIDYEEYNCYANFFQIACRYNEESVKELINNVPNLKGYIENVQSVEIDDKNILKFNAFKLALLYEPNTVALLLDSKYGSTKMITDTDELCKDNSCLAEIIEKQMSSYIRLKRSKYYNELIENNLIQGDILFKMEDMILYADQSEKLLKHKDVPCNMTNENICSTCFSNENKVIFSPCAHKCCVMCSTRLISCPQCRDKIIDKIVYN